MDAPDGPPLVGGPSASGPGPGLRIRLDLAYDGSGFHGFAENRGVETVGGVLRAALERVLRSPVELTCAGRTDRGVHARHQVVTFDLDAGAAGPEGPDLVRLRDSLNGLLGPQVSVRTAAVVPPTFDARFSARSRTYRYTVLAAEAPDPFLAATAWWVDRPLDLVAMREACIPLLGEHDFSSFCRRPKGVEVSLVRRVLAAGWSEVDGVLAVPDGARLLRFEITASAFCHQMVRSIVGLLVDVGRGRRTPADVVRALDARDRATAGQLAPPHGLVLWEVGY